MGKKSETGRESLLEVMEQMRDWVAAVTGMKQQLIDQGWSAENAERLVATAMEQARS